MRRLEKFVLFGVSSGKGWTSSNSGLWFEIVYGHSWPNIPLIFLRTKSLYIKQGRAWLDQVRLSDSDAHLLHAGCKLYDSIQIQIASTHALNNLAAQDPWVKG